MLLGHMAPFQTPAGQSAVGNGIADFYAEALANLKNSSEVDGLTESDIITFISRYYSETYMSMVFDEK